MVCSGSFVLVLNALQVQHRGWKALRHKTIHEVIFVLNKENSHATRKYDAFYQFFCDLHNELRSYTFDSRGECQLLAVQVLILKMFKLFRHLVHSKNLRVRFSHSLQRMSGNLSCKLLYNPWLFQHENCAKIEIWMRRNRVGLKTSLRLLGLHICSTTVPTYER